MSAPSNIIDLRPSAYFAPAIGDVCHVGKFRHTVTDRLQELVYYETERYEGNGKWEEWSRADCVTVGHFVDFMRTRATKIERKAGES